MIEEQLETIGLTKGEAKVYTTLLKIGESTTGKIIEESGLSSGKIYEILERLAKKGLATHIIREKTKYFSAATPKKILEYLEEQKKGIEEKKKEIEGMMPQLTKLQETGTKGSSALIYKGMEGLKTVSYDDLDSISGNEEILIIGISLRRDEKILNFWDKWTKERIKRKVKLKVIASTPEAGGRYKSDKFSEIRILETSGISPIGIYGDDRITLYGYSTLTFISIRDPEISKSFSEFFYSLWKIAKPL